jgi:phosphatidylinositol glycan class V
VWLTYEIDFPITTNARHDAVIHGVIVANVSHLLSVLILYQLVLAVLHNSRLEKPKYAFITSVLQVFAPAGVFLLAPYTEAPFSFLNFLGQLLYVYSWIVGPQEYGLSHDVALVASGVLFGVAATVRGNGLLSGLLFFVDAVIWFGSKVEKTLGVRILNLGGLSRIVQAEMRTIDVRRIPATIIAGVCVGIGFATPQYLAYREFCTSDLESRPWCSKFPPSIYSFVQEHYW